MLELKDKLKARRSGEDRDTQRRHVNPAIITNGLAVALSPAGVCPLTLKCLMVTSTLPPTQPAEKHRAHIARRDAPAPPPVLSVLTAHSEL
jgi:hypothetical protein